MVASHLYQAILDEEPHVADLDFITTLPALCTGASPAARCSALRRLGHVPNRPGHSRLRRTDAGAVRRDVAARRPGLDAAALLPKTLVAGQDAGSLTAEGAALLDPTGRLQPGAPVCPPRATPARAWSPPRRRPAHWQHQRGHVDLRDGGAGEAPDRGARGAHISPRRRATWSRWSTATTARAKLGTWAGVSPSSPPPSGPMRTRTPSSARCSPGARRRGGRRRLLAYNYLAGEPITGMAEGRPLVVRTPAAASRSPTSCARSFTPPSHAEPGHERAARRGRATDSMFAHGGMFKTAGVAQRFLAAAIGAPVTVGDTQARAARGHRRAGRVPAHWRGEA